MSELKYLLPKAGQQLPKYTGIKLGRQEDCSSTKEREEIPQRCEENLFISIDL